MVHRLEQTTDTLMKAFFHNHLVHGNPCACAVGNMCQGNPYWINTMNGTSQRIYHENLKLIPEFIRYTPEEILKIEYAFEGREADDFRSDIYPTGRHYPLLFPTNDPDSFKGLCNVFEVLEKIDADYFTEMESRVNIFQIINGIMPQEELV